MKIIDLNGTAYRAWNARVNNTNVKIQKENHLILGRKPRFF